MTDPVLRIVAAVVLDDDGHVLVVRKRGTTAFMQPGGKIEPGEQPLAALQREVVEELGTAVDPMSVRSLGRHHAVAANEPGHTVDAYLYLVRLHGTPAAAAEIEEMAWVDPASPGDVELAPLTRDTVLALARELV
ncbi:NUDIX domain-containing protein [Mycolicibacterium smegmatis]|uniref:NUDIX hydrolase n=1 Tax=Mycolicibacterium smegmatis TaxID=1772 RepID=UPI0005D9EEF5|nr:NUDIX domain-containing protein [Mycolicibacterium smegmatis]MDF1902179.1 NUDIX domain-containing protein [Mycolicibacterium smegmatis]MDF1909310.1 NUDIX domain-containing protein [Mycolicibacterium smegmatis]MDF1921024.1 NUDIX domain-containing protein [Mycolicibacterium smegmatis]MDF1922224.1 NUDIX domain-containing protein [Mycolicibacterium smegmatis]UAK56134.1 NUDIX domain-containing protein [Mycolicibacterium smegmatis]